MANSGIVRGFYEAFGRGDIPAAFSVLHQDVEFHEMQSLPWGKVYRGLPGMQEFLGEFVKWIGQDARIELTQVLDAKDGQVIVEAVLHGLGDSFRYLELWKFDGGKAIYIAPYLDTQAMVNRLRALGKL